MFRFNIGALAPKKSSAKAKKVVKKFGVKPPSKKKSAASSPKKMKKSASPCRTSSPEKVKAKTAVAAVAVPAAPVALDGETVNALSSLFATEDSAISTTSAAAVVMDAGFGSIDLASQPTFSAAIPQATTGRPHSLTPSTECPPNGVATTTMDMGFGVVQIPSRVMMDAGFGSIDLGAEADFSAATAQKTNLLPHRMIDLEALTAKVSNAMSMDCGFGVVDVAPEEKLGATASITENDEATFLVPSPLAEVEVAHLQGVPSAVEVAAALAECDRAEAEFDAANFYSDEPSDQLSCIFEEAAAPSALSEACQFHAEGLDIAPAEAEVDASPATSFASTPTAVALSTAPMTETTATEAAPTPSSIPEEKVAAPTTREEDATLMDPHSGF